MGTRLHSAEAVWLVQRPPEAVAVDLEDRYSVSQRMVEPDRMTRQMIFRAFTGALSEAWPGEQNMAVVAKQNVAAAGQQP